MKSRAWKSLFSLSIFFLIFIPLLSQPEPAQAGTYDCTSQSTIPQSECEALVTLYNSTDGDNWTDNTNWLTGEDPCAWFGISCVAGSPGYVDKIELGVNALSGTIPTEIGVFSNLTELWLHYNSLTGSIPAELGDLSNLVKLSLINNQLTGSIPPELGGLDSIDMLVFSVNQLTGSIPAELGSLSNLTNLNFKDNQLTGTVPEELGNLSLLTKLYLQDNPNLTGALPSTLADLELDTLNYENTNICTPQEPVFLSWHDAIWSLTPSGIACPYLAALTSPSGKISETNPAYNWEADDGADEYRLYVSGPSGTVYNTWLDESSVCVSDNCTYTIGGELETGNHTWYIQTRSAIASGPWTDGMEFEVGDPAPISPTGTISDVTPTYTWEEWEGAQDYRLFVSHATLGTVVDEWYEASVCTEGSCTATSDVHLRTGNHSFTFQAKNDAGTINVWSTYLGFKLLNSTSPDEAIVPISPTGGETTDVNPTYTWNAVERASWYKIFVGSQTTGKVYNAYHRAAEVCYGATCDVTPTNYLLSGSPVSSLEYATEFNWYVMPVNVAGNGSFSSALNFVTRP